LNGFPKPNRQAGMNDEQSQVAIPLLEERLITGKREVETGRVRVRTVIDEHETIVRDTLARGSVEVERVPMHVEVSEVPQPREEGDVLIVPVVQEVLVVEKKLILTEELRLHRKTSTEDYAQPVTLRSQRAVVEREETSGEAT
jgi:stress response protein YsnF